MAVQDPTTNYGWQLPNDQGDTGAWGAMLRVIFGDDVTGIDAIVKAISNVANAALPKAGGVMTGRIDVKTEGYTVTDLGGSLSGTVTCDLSLSQVFRGVCTDAITIAFSNVPASPLGVFITIELETSGSAHSISWPASVSFGAGFPISMTASRKQVFTLFTRDGGTKWRAAHLANMTL